MSRRGTKGFETSSTPAPGAYSTGTGGLAERKDGRKARCRPARTLPAAKKEARSERSAEAFSAGTQRSHSTRSAKTRARRRRPRPHSAFPLLRLPNPLEPAAPARIPCPIKAGQETLGNVRQHRRKGPQPDAAVRLCRPCLFVPRDCSDDGGRQPRDCHRRDGGRLANHGWRGGRRGAVRTRPTSEAHAAGLRQVLGLAHALQRRMPVSTMRRLRIHMSLQPRDQEARAGAHLREWRQR